MNQVFNDLDLLNMWIILLTLRMSIRFLYDAHVRITQFINYNFFVAFSVSSALEVGVAIIKLNIYYSMLNH